LQVLRAGDLGSRALVFESLKKGGRGQGLLPLDLAREPVHLHKADTTMTEALVRRVRVRIALLHERRFLLVFGGKTKGSA
jgi:hypothetical protein